SRFCIYAWRGAPDIQSIRPQPRQLGTMVFPTPMNSGFFPQPFQVGNNFGSQRLGATTFPTIPAPSRIGHLTHGIDRQTIDTQQGFIEDDVPAADVPASITNAVVLRIGG